MSPNNLTPDDCLLLVREEIARLRPNLEIIPQNHHQLNADLGLNSYDIVDLLAALESRLSLASDRILPDSEFLTVGGLCQACLASPAADPLAASLLRGQARRRR